MPTTYSVDLAVDLLRRVGLPDDRVTEAHLPLADRPGRDLGLPVTDWVGNMPGRDYQRLVDTLLTECSRRQPPLDWFRVERYAQVLGVLLPDDQHVHLLLGHAPRWEAYGSLLDLIGETYSDRALTASSRRAMPFRHLCNLITRCDTLLAEQRLPGTHDGDASLPMRLVVTAIHSALLWLAAEHDLPTARTRLSAAIEAMLP